MGIFDKNIHMNGAGTTYQAFLDLADAAEEKGGTIGDRTVRLVKAGDGLATTTSLGTKGARADQIAGARNAFLQAIAREYGYAARDIALKTLGAGKNAVPLTARSIRAVNRALGNKEALAADSAFIREFKGDFEIEVSFVRMNLSSRIDATAADFDFGKVQAEAMKLIDEGTYPKTKDGLRAAIREVAAPRVAVASRMEALFRARGVPAQLAPRLAARVLDKAMAIVDDYTVPSGDAVIGKFRDLVASFLDKNKDVFARYSIAETTANEAEDLLKTMFGPKALKDEDAAEALKGLKSKLDKLQNEKMSMKEFEAECERAFKITVKAHIVRQIGIEMTMVDSTNPSYGRLGVRLYDALGVGNGENDRAVTDYSIWSMTSVAIVSHLDLNVKTPEELRHQAAKLVFVSIAEDYANKLPRLADEHPHLDAAKHSVVHKVAAGFVDRFATAVTDDDFAKLADDFKTQLTRQLGLTNATLKNIDIAKEQAKGELEGRLEQLAGQHGLQLTQGIKEMFAKTFVEATDKMKSGAYDVDKALTAEECKAAILDRVEKKWLSLCRQAAMEIDASALDPAQKKAFLAKVMEGKVDVTHVKMALKTVPAFDATELVAAAQAGDGKKLTEQFCQFVAKTSAMITDKAELESIAGSDDHSAFVGTAAELLFVVNPGLGEGVRGLDDGSRGKLFEDAGQASDAKSREIQAKVQGEQLNDQQRQAVAQEARYWSSAATCAIHLQQAIA